MIDDDVVGLVDLSTIPPVRAACGLGGDLALALAAGGEGHAYPHGLGASAGGAGAAGTSRPQ